MPRVSADPSSRSRLLDAAAAEFAARGFDGAKVDRIAARARVNKAMLYYHFRSKVGLYRAVLLDLFQGVAEAVTAVRTPAGSPDDQARHFIRTIASEAVARPHFPSLWLREMAEGGRHLDAAIARQLQRVLGVLAAILDEGRQAGAFAPAHPFIVQLGIVAPLLLFTASAPLRERFKRDLSQAADIARDDLVAHVETATLAVLEPGTGRLRTPRSTGRSQR